MNKKLFFGLLAGLIIIYLAGYFINNKENNKELYGIVKFEYSYGGYPGGIWDYTILKKEDTVTIKAKGMNGVDLKLDKEIDASVLLELEAIINENKIYKWNGFSKRDNSIMDGDGFSLLVEYADGSKIKASGHMKFPNNYDIGHKALSEYLSTIE